MNKKGGGVALYFPSHFECRVLSDLTIMSDCLETVFVEVVIPEKRNLIIGVVYRPPQGNVDTFVNEIQTILSNSVMENKSVYFMGDFNVNLLEFDKYAHVNEFLDLLASFSYLPVITKPTRITEHSATLIDNIFCNIQPLPQSGIVISDLSDHFPVFTIFNFENKLNLPSNKYIRINNPQNIARFKETKQKCVSSIINAGFFLLSKLIYIKITQC